MAETDERAPLLQVTIHLDDMLFDPERGIDLSQRIVQECAVQLLERWHDDAYHTARALLNEALRERMSPMLDEAISRSLQPTDSWGQPKGDPISLHDVIIARCEEILRDRSSTRGTRNQSLLDQKLQEAVDSTFERELQAAMREAKAEVMTAVREKAAQVLAETIAQMAKGT